MRHRRQRRKLGVKSGHRKALLRNFVRNMVAHKRIKTTWAKAKEASAFCDSMVELAKKGANLHARRTLIARLGNSQTAHALITQIAPHFKERKGGYTRVLRLGQRVGDNADMALLEFTATIESPEKPKKPKKEKTATAKPLEIRKETAPEKKKTQETKTAESRKEEKKASSEEKKESEKKGGFLGALRRFLKGDDEQR